MLNIDQDAVVAYLRRWVADADKRAEALRDLPSQVRADRQFDGIGPILQMGLPALPGLVAALQDFDEEMRAAAANVLSLLRYRDAIAPLQARLEVESGPKAQGAIKNALYRLEKEQVTPGDPPPHHHRDSSLVNVRFDDDMLARVQPLAVLDGHTGPVMAVAFNRACNLVASGGADGFLCLWDATTGDLLSVFEGHAGPVVSVQFDNRHTLVSLDSSGTIRFWDIATRRATGQPWHAPDAKHIALDYYAKYLGAGRHMFDAKTGDKLHEVPAQGESVAAVYDKLWVTNAGATVVVSDITKRAEVARLTGLPAPVIEVGISPEGRYITAVDSMYNNAIWTRSGDTWQSGGGGSQTSAMTFINGWFTLVVGNLDHTLRLLSVRTGGGDGVPVAGHSGRINHLAAASNGKMLASASDDGTVRLWGVRAGLDYFLAKAGILAG